MDGADNYSDCKFASTDDVEFLNGRIVSNVQSEFNIKWTDRKENTEKTCCAALKPLLHNLFLDKRAVINWQPLCDSCKEAYNPAVGLAAFRACAFQTGSAPEL
jgi:hypothetical protein